MQMTIIFICILLFIIIIVILINYWGKKPYIHKNIKIEDTSKYLEALLKRGYDKSFLIIYVKNKNKEFIQFRKILNNNVINLELCFPLAEWSKNYYDNLQKFLLKENIRFEIIDKNKKDLLEFTIVNCGVNIQLSVFLIRNIFLKIFNFDETYLRFKIFIVNGSPLDEIIGILPENGTGRGVQK